MQNKPVIILISPQMGENIGAAARAMKNFAVSELRIVTPRDGWPNKMAEANAVGAIDLIHNAKIYNDLESAISDLEYIYATSAKPRSLNKDYVTTKTLPKSYKYDAKVGILFGRENSGLTNAEIAHANAIISIDTNVDFTSLNLAQAILLVCYELFTPNIRADLDNAQELCRKDDLQYFFDHLFGELQENGFLKDPYRSKYIKQNIMNIFNRIDKLTHNEVQTLRGIISSLGKKK
jgi:tRNA/rRNA methyltransferase